MILSNQDPVKLLDNLKIKPEDYWTKRGEKMAFALFRQMSERVPAYKDFLQKNNIKSSLIKSIDDFHNIPTIDKDNYLRSYPLEALCWDGELSKNRFVFSTTSGSTGEPFYFPRQDMQDWQYALLAEMYLRNNFEIHRKSTLYINGFAMGAWIGGLFTYQAIKLLAERGKYNLSIISPGIYKKEIVKAVKNLGNKFDQVIIGGYPPFIKDTLEEGALMGLDWKKYNLGFIFSAETFTERFRDHIIEKTGLTNSYTSTLNHYGTVDLGTMAHETPLSILLRRNLENNTEIKHELLPELHKQPTIVQYLPELFFFEEENKGLICTASSGLPLVRYNLKDYGGVLSLSRIRHTFQQFGIDFFQVANDEGIKDLLINLPFVYVYERLDFTVKLYAANIYPETIRRVIQEKPFSDFLTGKFTMTVKLNKQHDQYLEINFELRPMCKESTDLSKKLQEAIVKALLKENSEYKSNYKEAPSRQIPEMVFWPYEHPLHFVSGGKQKWVK